MTWANHTLFGAAALAAMLSGPSGARAQDVAVIAIPGHADVPVIINGRDASYRLVVGDWGLARPGAVPVVVYGPEAYAEPDGRGYYPSTGRRPRSGRQEIENPSRVLPPRAPSFHRSWSTSSNMDAPTTTPAGAASPPGAASDGGQSDADQSNRPRHPRHRRSAGQTPDDQRSATPHHGVTGAKPPMSNFPHRRKRV